MSATKTKAAASAQTQAPPAAQEPDVPEGAFVTTGAGAAGQGTAVSTAVDYGADAGAGMENIDRDELIVPRLTILQSNSPQVEEGGPAQIPGAKAGMLFNLATQEMWDGKEGVKFVAVSRDHNYVEFIPRDAGGGFVGLFDPDDPLVKQLRKAQGEYGKLIKEGGNEITETYYIYGLLITPDGEIQSTFIGFSSTQIKKYKMIVTRLASLLGSPKPKYPMFAFRWHLSTVPESNKKGRFHGWRMALDGEKTTDALLPPDSALYLRAREFNKLLAAGVVSADYTQAGDQSGPEDAGAAGHGGETNHTDEDIPM